MEVAARSNPSGYTALHLACLTGHVGVVGLLLSRSTDLLKVVDEAGQSCLHIGGSGVNIYSLYNNSSRVSLSSGQ